MCAALLFAEAQIHAVYGQDAIKPLPFQGSGSTRIPPDPFTRPLFTGVQSRVANFVQDFLIAELNGDGVPDVIVATNFFPFGLHAMYGDGRGRFEVHTSIDITGHFEAMQLLRSSPDGQLEFVIATSDPEELAFFRFQPATGFTRRGVIPSASFPTALAVGSLFRKESRDLAIGGAGTNELLLFEERTPGEYGPAVPLATSISFPYLVELRDLDEDGLAEILVGSRVNPFLEILYRSDVGPQSVVIPLANGANALLVDDLDDDGHQDVLIADNSSVLPFYGDGTGGLVGDSPLLTSRTSTSLHCEDVDGDGLKDFFATSGGTVSVFQGLGGRAHGPESFSNLHAPVSQVKMEDMDGEGARDLVALHNSAASIVFYPNRPKSGLQLPIPVQPDGFSSLDVHDYNGDSIPDIVSSGLAFHGRGNNEYDLVDLTCGGGALDFQAADVVGGPEIDNICLYDNTNVLDIQQGMPDGTF